MIRKEEIDVRELNRKVHAKAQLKPSLDAFPMKDVSVPFNSLRNRHGILNAELEVPQSFKDETLGVAEQINEIRNGKQRILESEPTENLQLNITDNEPLVGQQPMVGQQPLVEQPTEVSEPVSSGEVNRFLDDIQEEISKPPSVEDKPQIDNKFLRAMMDIRRNTIINKTLIVLFLVIMAVLIYFGFHKNI